MDWMWVQLRTGFRRQHAYQIPEVGEPGCADGVVSTRHWLDWRQANSVNVFGVEFMRRVSGVLAANGVTPVDAWVEQSWHTRAGSPTRHQSFMDPHGEANVAALVNKVTYPVDSLTFHQLVTDVVPQVLQSFPMDLSKTVGKPGEHMIAPYLWTIDLRTPQIPSTFKTRNDLREIVFTSPHYYCGYTAARLPVNLTSRHWPLKPQDELEPVISNFDPTRKPKRAEVAAAAKSVVDAVSTLSEHLGIHVCPAEGGEWQESTPTTRRFVVKAPVQLVVSSDELYERAQPYWGRIYVWKENREPAAAHIHRRLHLAQFNGYPGFRAWITDPDADGRFVLTVEST